MHLFTELSKGKITELFSPYTFFRALSGNDIPVPKEKTYGVNFLEVIQYLYHPHKKRFPKSIKEKTDILHAAARFLLEHPAMQGISAVLKKSAMQSMQEKQYKERMLDLCKICLTQATSVKDKATASVDTPPRCWKKDPTENFARSNRA